MDWIWRELGGGLKAEEKSRKKGPDRGRKDWRRNRKADWMLRKGPEICSYVPFLANSPTCFILKNAGRKINTYMLSKRKH